MRARREQRQGKTSHPDDTDILVSRKLVRIWFEYVYSERTQNGLHNRLRITNHGECYCGKGRMSYPHWPPTSHQEAMDLLYNCFDKENTHRRYIAYCWWVFTNRLATMTPWVSSTSQKWYKDRAAEILQNCPAVFKELQQDKSIPLRLIGWSCRETCELILRERRCECTCFCKDYESECPLHRW